VAVDRTSEEAEWQRTANAVGIGLGVASLGFGISQATRRPEVAIGALAVSAALTYMLWRGQSR